MTVESHLIILLLFFGCHFICESVGLNAPAEEERNQYEEKEGAGRGGDVERKGESPRKKTGMKWYHKKDKVHRSPARWILRTCTKATGNVFGCASKYARCMGEI